MLASVLPFRRRPAPREWTDHDKAEFFRVIDVLGRVGILLELEIGLTDEGEPWAVFCVSESGEPVIHIARLGACYVLAATTLAEPLRGPELHALVRVALQDTRAAVLPKSDNGVLALHPAALLMVLVATCWFQAAHAADPATDPSAKRLRSQLETPTKEEPFLPELDATSEREAQEPGGDHASLRFQHSLAVAVAMLALMNVGSELASPIREPTATDMMSLLDEAGAAPAQTHEEDDLTAGPRSTADLGSVLSTDPMPVLADAPLAPSPAMPPTVAQAEVVSRQAGATPAKNSFDAAAASISIDGGIVWRQDGALLQLADDGLLDVNWSVVAQTYAPARPAGGPPALGLSDPAPALPAVAEPARNAPNDPVVSLDAYQALLLVQPAKALTTASELAPELAQKFAALIRVDLPLQLRAPAEPPSETMGAEIVARPPLASATSVVLQESVTLLSAGGQAGATEQQVSLDAALAQLREFTKSTPDHLTILANKSLVLVDPAVLTSGQSSAYSSFTMSDGSEIAWVYPVGVSAMTWYL